MNFRHHLITILLSSLPFGALAEVYEMPADGNDVIGALTTIAARADDTLLDIARRHGLGYEDIVRANPDVDTWLPGEGTEVVLPTRYVLPPGPRTGIVLNLAEYRMYYFPKPKAGETALVMTYPMSIGRHRNRFAPNTRQMAARYHGSCRPDLTIRWVITPCDLACQGILFMAPIVPQALACV
jgi:lipoprotein-anchoring transpeptidase ErfK/SrfK